MTLTDFLQHWSLTENPFKGEEARSDQVFSRMATRERATLLPVDGLAPTPAPPAAADLAAIPVDAAAAPSPSVPAPRPRALDGTLFHSDFEKILGDLRRPASSVVFGEKGSGKTAIRLQIARRVGEHNAANPGAKVLLVGYDDLNGTLDRLHERLGGKTPLESLQKTRLVDHMDAILHRVVPRVVDAILGVAPTDESLDLGDPRRPARRLDPSARRDLLLLQTLYDRPDVAPDRTRALRRRLGIWAPANVVWGSLFLYLTPLLLLAAFIYTRYVAPPSTVRDYAPYALAGVAALYALFAFKHGVYDRLALLRTAHRVKRQLRVIPRGDISYARSLRHLAPALRDPAHLPVSDSDDPRYALLDRLRRVLRAFGYAGLVVVIDRVDEPTLVSGDPDRMKAVVWPLLNNKFLQQEGVGLKLLLPMELRHAVFRESSAFFQEARLDKQSLIEHLAWTGPMLYDLCEARMAACRHDSAQPAALLDLFAADVTRQDLVDALDRVHQPRDAFKLLYRCLTDHCANVTRGENQWKIPRHVLLNVQKSETERVQQMYRGIRPG